MLSDNTIRHMIEANELKINVPEEWPLQDHQFQPASLDLRLGEVADPQPWPISPGQFLLASTIEEISMPAILCGRVEGKSSWARRGLIVHAAGFVDPGFQGQLTLELFNMSAAYIPLVYGALIAQISFDFLDYPAKRIYGHPELHSHYQGQVGPTPVRWDPLDENC